MQNLAARHFAKKAGKVYRQQLRDRHWRCVALYGNAKEHSRERIAKLMLAYTQLLATS
jgi:RimJ/RimL family protein N-acetyltransferase